MTPEALMALTLEQQNSEYSRCPLVASKVKRVRDGEISTNRLGQISWGRRAEVLPALYFNRPLDTHATFICFPPP